MNLPSSKDDAGESFAGSPGSAARRKDFVRRWLSQAARFKAEGDIKTARGCLRRAWLWKRRSDMEAPPNVPVSHIPKLGRTNHQTENL